MELIRTITQQKIRVWFRNTLICEMGVSYSYSRLIHDLYRRSNRNCLCMISNEII
uniref:Uncharacterized protein n=1 Tax=Solanum lycopersicum TaxID=4081 RepID=A0A3Q7IXM0_SOLLC